MKPIDPAKKYLIKGSTLKLLMSRKVTGADGEILTQRDADGNVTLRLANVRRCLLVDSGQLRFGYIPIRWE